MHDEWKLYVIQLMAMELIMDNALQMGLYTHMYMCIYIYMYIYNMYGELIELITCCFSSKPCLPTGG